jgi:hypothetical protein
MTMALSFPSQRFHCSGVDREKEQGTATDVNTTAQEGYRRSTASEEWHRNVRNGNAINGLTI